jgi:hypothetical protein
MAMQEVDGTRSVPTTSNPFATRFIRPGAMRFLFEAGESAEAVVERLRASRWWGQIIGPHGSGKSTLLATLARAIETAGRKVVLVGLHQGEHRLPPLDRSSLGRDAVLVIDGYEQLSWWSRRRVKSLCRRCGAGLLVTAHDDVGLPTVFETSPSLGVAQRVVAELVRAAETKVSGADVAAAYEAVNGNVREALFRLYDVYRENCESARATRLP